MNIGIERSIQSLDLLTFVYVLIFVILIFVKLRFAKEFLSLCTCFFSKTFFIDYAIELSTSFSLFKAGLFLFQNLVFSVFLINMIAVFYPNTFMLESSMFGMLFLLVSLYFIFQYFFGYIISVFFRFTDLYKSVFALKFSYLKVISLILLPMLLYQNYGVYEDRVFVGTVVTVIFLILLLLSFVLFVINNNKIIIERLFYFILYLCALEIAPLLIVYKIAVNK